MWDEVKEYFQERLGEKEKISLVETRNINNLELDFQVPEERDRFFVYGIYDDAIRQKKGYDLIKLIFLLGGSLWIASTIRLMAGSTPQIMRLLFLTFLFPFLMVVGIVVYIFYESNRRKELLRMVKDDEFMLAKVKFVGKKSQHYYSRGSIEPTINYYVVVEDAFGNEAKVKTGKMVFDDAYPTKETYLIQFDGGKRGYWDKMDLYVSSRTIENYGEEKNE